MLDKADIDFITAEELANITEEDISEFLSRDPINGFWVPELWASEVFENFLSNQVFYYDKLVRGTENGVKQG
jgi:hypothetical protein